MSINAWQLECVQSRVKRERLPLVFVLCCCCDNNNNDNDKKTITEVLKGALCVKIEYNAILLTSSIKAKSLKITHIMS